MINTSVKAKTLALGVFFLGIATGVLLSNVYETRVRGDSVGTPVKEKQEKEVHDFCNYLTLQKQQCDQFHEVLEEAGPEFRKLGDQTRPQYDALREQTRAKIRVILTPEQKKKYDEFNESLKKRRPRPE